VSEETMSERRRRVLIVEDSPAMRQLLALALKRAAGVSIDQAEDGVAALKALKVAQSEPYDLVFLDLNMPVMDGMKLLARIRDDAAYANTTIAVVTTEERLETEAQARELGARYFIRKPVNRKIIEKILSDVFGIEPR
jgi:two-component system, chemotaxis family, chemotaxis protein CheY